MHTGGFSHLDERQTSAAKFPCFLKAAKGEFQSHLVARDAFCSAVMLVRHGHCDAIDAQTSCRPDRKPRSGVWITLWTVYADDHSCFITLAAVVLLLCGVMIRFDLIFFELGRLVRKCSERSIYRPIWRGRPTPRSQSRNWKRQSLLGGENAVLNGNLQETCGNGCATSRKMG